MENDSPNSEDILNSSTEPDAGKMLCRAAYDGDYNSVKKLLEDGVSTEVISQEAGFEGWRPIHFAAVGGEIGVLFLLYTADCNLESLTHGGMTPLQVAAKVGNIGSVKWFIGKGVCLYHEDDSGNTAEDIAKAVHHDVVVRCLQKCTIEFWKLKLDGLQGKRILSKTVYGEVFQSERIGKPVVVKMQDLTVLGDLRKEYAHREMKIHKMLKHPCIVSYLSGGIKDDYIYIEMEYCSGGDLGNRILEQRKQNCLFEKTQVINWCKFICSAMEYLHSSNILHRNIKPRNILLTDCGVAKLGDFSTAIAFKKDSLPTIGIGTQAYMAPEHKSKGEYDSSSDMWSFGCVMYELATLKVAFPFEDLEFPKAFRVAYEEAVMSLLQQDPKKRPKAADLLRLPLFQDTFEEKESRSS